MAIPSSEVGYTSAITRRGGPQNLCEHVAALGEKIYFMFSVFKELITKCIGQNPS
jgi:hypothetical protein